MLSISISSTKQASAKSAEMLSFAQAAHMDQETIQD